MCLSSNEPKKYFGTKEKIMTGYKIDNLEADTENMKKCYKLRIRAKTPIRKINFKIIFENKLIPINMMLNYYKPDQKDPIKILDITPEMLEDGDDIGERIFKYKLFFPKVGYRYRIEWENMRTDT